MLDSENLGVHFVTADGGFSVEGKENIQEILSKQLYLCQCLCALLILRKGGHFLVKVFDLFTEFSADLLHIMRHVSKWMDGWNKHSGSSIVHLWWVFFVGVRIGLHFQTAHQSSSQFRALFHLSVFDQS